MKAYRGNGSIATLILNFGIRSRLVVGRFSHGEIVRCALWLSTGCQTRDDHQRGKGYTVAPTGCNTSIDVQETYIVLISEICWN
jgi:hypothetical protein